MKRAQIDFVFEGIEAAKLDHEESYMDIVQGIAEDVFTNVADFDGDLEVSINDALDDLSPWLNTVYGALVVLSRTDNPTAWAEDPGAYGADKPESAEAFLRGIAYAAMKRDVRDYLNGVEAD
jgi:hypothetical protein